jgi:hypothetical protein
VRLNRKIGTYLRQFTHTAKIIDFNSAKSAGAWFRSESRGYFYVPQSGTYTFHIGSDDGSKLEIDGRQVVNQWYAHTFKWKSGRRYLRKGWHRAKAEMF